MTGLKCSYNTVNSPMKAWRHIFTASILEMIVKHTNEYGMLHCRRWVMVSKSDITDFFAILFIASIQKRKDKTMNWWSNDPLLEYPIMKKIMTGRKFHRLLRYLHVCDLKRQPSFGDIDYSPTYKIQELMDALTERYDRSFVPGEHLSLDESLIRTFGRIKFKVRIVTKSARYGIKVYVITDAVTAFVLKVIIYTGKYTYHNNTNDDMKKTVKVVKELCKEYEGSHRTIFTDRFYTSIDLAKELDKMGLYITGTCMKNRIPKDVTIKKTGGEFRNMTRGSYKYHSYKYAVEERVVKYGLVAWKDRDIVYCFSSNTSTRESDTCYRRSKDGRVLLERPKMIAHYNRYMGGVDLADMRRLHCNSTIMGKHRWWLKLFFYLLDVGTSNALVLHTQTGVSNMNIVEFKKA